MPGMPQLMPARCMSAATEFLKPLMVGEGTEPVGRVCLGTVKGDMHDIGKNLVHIMMEGSGIEVFDLGVDTSAEQFVSTAVENHCGVIACSSLLTTTMEEMREVVKLVHAAYRIRSRSWSAARPSARASATRSAQITTPKTPVPPPAKPSPS